MATDLLSALNAPDAQLLAQQASRQQMLADLLRQRAMTQQDPNAMVSGRVVPIGLGSLVGQAANQYVAGNAQQKADSLMRQASQQKQAALMQMFGMTGASGPGSAAPAPQQSAPMPSAAPPSVQAAPNQDIFGPSVQSQPMPAQPAGQAASMPASSSSQPFGQSPFRPNNMTPQQAMAMYMTSPDEYAKVLAGQYMPTDMQKNNQYLGIDPNTARQLELAQRAKAGVMEVQPGNTVVDPTTMKPRYAAPDFKSGINNGFDRNGNPVMGAIPGSGVIAKLEGQKAGAVAAAQGNVDTTTVQTPQGPVLMTRTGAARAAGSGLALQKPEQQKQDTDIATQFGKRYGDIVDAGFAAPNKIASADQMQSLLAGVKTGKLTPVGTELAAYANSMGLDIDKDLGNKQAAEAVSNKLALELRNPAGGAGMPGAMSDADRNYLKSMTPGLGLTAEGNAKLIDATKKLATRDQQVAQMAQDYRKTHGTFDEGFTKELQQFSAANPLFSRNGSAGVQNAIPPGWSVVAH